MAPVARVGGPLSSPDDPTQFSSQRSFTPELVQRALARGPRGALPTANTAPAAVLFADITGFTPISERYAQRGPTGIEELSELLQRWFGGLVDLIAAHGGDVVKFAGDALLAVWLGLPGEDPEETCARAAACGLAVARGPGRAQADDGVTLDLKLAVGAGELCWMQLGGVAGQRQLFVTGAPVRQVGLAQRFAGAGELVLSPEAWALVAGRARGQTLPSGGVRLDLLEAPPPRRLPADPLDGEAVQALRAFVPAAVRARLDAGQAAWLAELRHVSVVFVVLPDLSEHTPPEQAQAVVVALLSVCETHEATLNGFSVDEKGAFVKLVLGLPPQAHQDDPRRAIELARALSSALTTQGRPHSVGVATGRVYCGTVGSTSRREYMMVGDTVNLAARLAVAAATHSELGSLPALCDEATARACTTPVRGLELRALAPMSLKGKSALVPVHGLYAVAETAALSSAPLIGREVERDKLERALDALQAGRTSLFVVEGEAGIGKSRLLAHLRERAVTRLLPVLEASAESTDRKESYRAWRPAVERLLEALGPDVAAGGARLVAALQQRDPELAALAPLLEAFLPLGLKDTAFTGNLSGENRADHIRQALLALLRAVLGSGPLVLLVEDVHWMDSASWGLLSWLCSKRTPMVVVTSTRPTLHETADLRSLRADPRCESLTLAPLSQGESLELAAQVLGASSLPSALAELVAERAEGHPFFSAELVWAVRDAGLIRVADGRCELAVSADEIERVSLPDTLRSAITERIDRLEPPLQLTAKVASVIGRMFALPVLADIHPIEAERSRLPEELAILAERNLTRRVQDGPVEVHAFGHALTRDVAYELMSYAQRRQLHRAVALHLEGSPEQRAHMTPQLAHHWLRSLDEREPDPQDGMRALGYLVQAGEQALRDFANEEAVGFLEDALALDARLGVVMHPRQRADVECWLGQACLHLGRMPASGEHLQRAIALLDRPVPGWCGLLPRLLVETWAQIRFQLGLVHAPGGPRPEAKRASDAYGTLFVVRYQANQALQTSHAAMRSLALASRAGDLPGEADGLATLGLMMGTAPVHGLARRFIRQALERAERSGRPDTLAWVLEVAGVYASGVGQWTDVERWVGQAAELAEQIGHRRRWEETQAVLSWLSYFQGQPGRAAEQWAEVAASAQKRRDPQPRIWGLCGMVESGWLAGASLESCREQLTESRILLPDDIYRAEAIRTLGVSALVAARSEAVYEARHMAHATLDAARGLLPTTFYSVEGYAGALETLLGLEVRAPDGAIRRSRRRAASALAGFARVFPIARPRLAWCAGLVSWHGGRRSAARRRWEAGLVQARALGMPLEALRLLDAFAMDGDAARDEEADATARELGVERARIRPWWWG